MDSPITFPLFKWAEFGNNDCFEAIDEINDIYRKIITIGKAKKVLCDQVCPMMTDKTKDKPTKSQGRLNEKY